MKIRFVAGFSPITADPAASRDFYGNAVGVNLDSGDTEYPYTHTLGGVKHFGLWPLAEAALACFGTPDWPADLAVPQATIEFEVENVAAAEQELVAAGHALVHGTRIEPWGQTARLLSPEGLLVGIVSTPWLGDA